MYQQDQIQIQLQDLKKQIEETRMEIRTQERRLDGLWWKIGLMAGILSILVSEIYGHTVGGLVADIIGWWPL